ncbi:MAG: peptidoglycan-binding domain-containing protein [Candidatus Sungbacteria bacterium]|nr:peptidoglycan-binding domain-containing protein [Candidatus Sungbacteria bacterium]
MIKKIIFIAALFFFILVGSDTHAAFTFTNMLSRGKSHSEVSELQRVLSGFSDIYPERMITGFFGAKTEEAVKRFQKKYGIEQTGTVGPKTRAKLNQLYVYSSSPVPQKKLATPSQSVAPASASVQKSSSPYPPPLLLSISSNALSQEFSAGKCEGKGPVVLTSPPIKMADTVYILPMGFMSGSHVTPVDHFYFHTSHKNTGRYDVLAPADGYMVSVEKVGDSQDYRLIIEHTCTFYSIYIHVTELAPKILSVMNPLSQRSWTMRVPVRAAEVIGTKVPDIQAKTFQVDFSVANADVMLKGFITPGYYNGEPWKIHTDDIYGYYKEPLRSELIKKSVRTAPPISGKIDYDIDGRLVGNWFRAGTNGYSGSNPYQYWEGHLAIAYDYIDPTKIRISIGNWGGKSEKGAVTGNMPDPKEVSVETGLVKYELIDSHYIHANGKIWDQETFANDIQLDISHPYLIGTLLVQMIDK